MNFKVNLEIGIKQPMNGFLNIDPTSNGQNPEIIAFPNIGNLDPLLDHNSCDLFLCMDILDYFPLQARAQILVNYLCKIAYNGKIVVGGTDIREVGRSLYRNSIDILKDGNALIYGNGKKSIITMDNSIEIIHSTNQFNIIGKKFDGHKYIIEAQRKVPHGN